MQVINVENGCPIFSWCPNIEEEALELMKNLMLKPYIKYGALMPDSHHGSAAPIGSVLACDNVVIPWAVGSDIGCGMGAIKTNLHKSEIIDKDTRKRILHSISRGVPVGFNHNTQKRENELQIMFKDEIEKNVNETLGNIYEVYNPIGDFREAFVSQLGTLGGGNHFLEIQYDQNDMVYIMIHSGSRNLGAKIGDYFNELATDLNNKWYSESRDVPFLPVETKEGKAYLGWMNFALKFAFLNRKVMLNEVMKVFRHEFSNIKFITEEEFKDAKDNIINIHHNFVSLENHFGKNYYIHRKGATMAKEGMTCIIPGSMSSGSYLAKGLGNKQSMLSCSHGAGRKMGRKAFCRLMKDRYEEIEKSLEDVVHSDFGEITHGKDKGLKDVSEAGEAYKDIESVMEYQKDLVEPIVTLKPMICLKG